MTLNELLDQIKRHPDYHKAGMILCHNGVVRETSRDGRKVSGLKVKVDHGRLDTIMDAYRKRPGIIEILIHLFEDRDLAVGDDVMYIVVAGDIRDNVIATLTDLLNDVKQTVTSKTEFYTE